MCFALASQCMAYRALGYNVLTSTSMLLMVVLTITTVVVEDVIMFFLSFEVLLLVMYLVVSSHWYAHRATYSLYVLVVYTMFGSTNMVMGFMLQYMANGGCSSPNGIDASLHSTSSTLGATLVMVGMMSKIPCYPFHHWLTEAHVESTT